MHYEVIKFRGELIRVSRIYYFTDKNITLVNPIGAKKTIRVPMEHLLMEIDESACVKPSRLYDRDGSLINFNKGKIKRFHICENDLVQIDENNMLLKNLGAWRDELGIR